MRSALLLAVQLCLHLSLFAQGNVRFPIHAENPSLYYRCYALIYDNSVGIGFDPKNNFFIIKSHRYFLPTKFGMLADFDIRTFRKGNNNISLDLTTLNLAKIEKGELSLSAGYKRILVNHRLVTEQIFMGPALFRARLSVTVAHAFQQQQFDDRNITSNGVMVRVYKEYLDRIAVIASTTFWFDQTQYSVRIREYLFSGTCAIGVGWEKVNDWQGFDIELLIRVR
jgi:hypothetical protein